MIAIDTTMSAPSLATHCSDSRVLALVARSCRHPSAPPQVNKKPQARSRDVEQHLARNAIGFLHQTDLLLVLAFEVHVRNQRLVQFALQFKKQTTISTMIKTQLTTTFVRVSLRICVQQPVVRDRDHAVDRPWRPELCFGRRRAPWLRRARDAACRPLRPRRAGRSPATSSSVSRLTTDRDLERAREETEVDLPSSSFSSCCERAVASRAASSRRVRSSRSLRATNEFHVAIKESKQIAARTEQRARRARWPPQPPPPSPQRAPPAARRRAVDRVSSQR